MLKKTLSFALLTAMVFGALVTVEAQEGTMEEPIWESIMLTPDNTKLKVFGENMRKHNQKYHNAGAHSVTVYTINSGPNTGKLVWMMGPLKFADLDTRPAAGGHDEDWRDNVMPYVKKIESGEYWEQDDKLSNTSMLTPDNSIYPILHVRYWEVNSEHGHSVDRVLKQISDAVKSMEGENPWGVYDNLFRQGNLGRHLATVGFSKKWAEYDEDPKFKAAFLKVHGNESWDTFILDYDQVLDNSWDEIWVYDKKLSGN